MKRNFIPTLSTNMPAQSCKFCNKLFPLGDARTRRRELQRHTKKHEVN